MVAPVMLTAEQVSERVDTKYGVKIKPETWRRYVYGDRAPAPDGYTGRTPTWRASTVDEWAKTRPGRGVGGGAGKHKARQQDQPAEPAPAVA